MTLSTKVSAGQRRQMIAEAAYFRAERRGFRDGDPTEDWYAAERDVDARLRRLEAEHVVGALDEVVAGATRKLAALKRRLTGLSLEARTELTKDMDRLGELRDSLKLTLGDLKERGEQAGRKLRAEAEAAATELRALLDRMASRDKPAARKRTGHRH
jgi:hypothetical protein